MRMVFKCLLIVTSRSFGFTRNSSGSGLIGGSSVVCYFFTQNLCESASDPIFRRYFVYYKKWPVSLAAMKLHMSLANVFGIFKQKECVKTPKNIDGASTIVKWNIVSKHFFFVFMKS